MHAFGLSKDLCDEFLRKQSVISNITKGKMSNLLTFARLNRFFCLFSEQEKMLYDNINRMYKETAKWRVN